MAGIPIPRVLDDLTSSWFADALGRDVGGDARVEPIGVGVGILGQLAKVRLGDGTRLVAKIATAYDETRAIAQFYGFYRTEVSFYRDVAHRDMGLRLPCCHYADLSDDAGYFVLLLEDLSDAVALDQIDGCPVPQAERVVDAMAAFHAHWWQSPALDELSWLRPLNNDAYKAGQQTYEQVRPLFVDRYAAKLPAKGVEIAQRLGGQLAEMYDNVVATRPLTIAHTDLRLDNMFFDLPDGSPFALLDWQLTIRGVGAGDVAYFLSESLQIEDRRTHEDKLLRRYHDALVAHGVRDYSFDDCWLDYLRGLVLSLAIPVVGSSMEAGNERGRRLMDTMVERAIIAVADHDAGRVLLR